MSGVYTRPMRARVVALSFVVAVAVVDAGCQVVIVHKGEGEGEAGEGAEGEGEGSAGTPDGAPQYRACTGTFGDEVGTDEYGRLDGFLRAVVVTGTGFNCRGDDDHLHLQVEAEGRVVDVAVNLDVGVAEVDHAPVEAWSEGFHTGVTFDYVRDLDTHAAAFDDASAATVESRVTAALSSANHVTIYARGYANDGVHDVHRNGSLRDGAIVAKPTEGSAHYVLFRFSDQAF